jgi:hypothetical protein
MTKAADGPPDRGTTLAAAAQRRTGAPEQRNADTANAHDVHQIQTFVAACRRGAMIVVRSDGTPRGSEPVDPLHGLHVRLPDKCSYASCVAMPNASATTLVIEHAVTSDMNDGQRYRPTSTMTSSGASFVEHMVSRCGDAFSERETAEREAMPPETKQQLAASTALPAPATITSGEGPAAMTVSGITFKPTEHPATASPPAFARVSSLAAEREIKNEKRQANRDEEEKNQCRMN